MRNRYDRLTPDEINPRTMGGGQIMATQRLTIAQSRKAARTFISRGRNGRQWGIAAAEGCLPTGWHLEFAEDGDFRPVTIKNVAATYRACARRDQMEA